MGFRINKVKFKFFIEYIEQAEAEVVPSSSLVSVRFRNIQNLDKEI